ncbi:MAG TPA: hypothetical protein VHL11_18670 [Phototrophicaceae bacterium]|jgi:hypothetical protein|nr:hypothetical protein [Phototrophicaceae bacterium]
MADIKAYTPTDAPQKLGQVYPQTTAMMQRLRDQTVLSDEALAKRMNAVHEMKLPSKTRKARVDPATAPTSPVMPTK